MFLVCREFTANLNGRVELRLSDYQKVPTITMVHDAGTIVFAANTKIDVHPTIPEPQRVA